MKFDFWRLFPRYWVQNAPRDDAWDQLLNDALDATHPTILSEYECRVGPFVIWTKNWPYAYGTSRGSGLPTVATRKRLRAAIGEARRAELAAFLQKQGAAA